MPFADAKSRFSSRVADYVRYRPGYPSALIDLLRDECGLLPAHHIADIGSGTGLLSKLFVQNGNRVYGVEPNAEMRAAGDEFLAAYQDFISFNGTAEATGLADACVDFVTAAQAFHWFDPVAARREFQRILKPHGWVVVLWNDRDLDRTPFGRDYEDLLVKFSTDYTRVKDAYPDTRDMHGFFGGASSPSGVACLFTQSAGEGQTGSSPRANFQRRALPNFQEFDFDALCGRLRSSSYAPQPGHPDFEPMMAALRRLFDANQRNGVVRMNYTTQIYFGRLNGSLR
jgi:SAM-dependent methyltransferase